MFSIEWHNGYADINPNDGLGPIARVLVRHGDRNSVAAATDRVRLIVAALEKPKTDIGA